MLADGEGRYLNRPQTIIQVGTPIAALCRFEQQALARFASRRGQAFTAEEQARLLSWGRDDARAWLFADLLRVVNTPVGERTPDEQAAYVWLQERVRATRIGAAQRARHEYDLWRRTPCSYRPPAPFTYDPGCTDGSLLLLFTGPPRPPSYPEFVQYGTTATLDALYTPEGSFVAAQMSRSLVVAAVLGAVGAGVLGTASVLASVGVTLSAIFPFVLEGSAVAVGSASVMAMAVVVVVMIVVSVTRGIQIAEDAEIPGQLDDDVAASQTLPDLTAMDDTEADLSLLLGSFIDATLPDHPNPPFMPSAPTAPDADAPGFLVVGGDRTSPRFEQVITYVDDDGLLNRAWIDDGWWVIDPGDGGPNRLALDITYRDRDGTVRSASIAQPDRFVVLDAHSTDPVIGCPAPVCDDTDVLHLQTELAEAPGARVAAEARLVDVPIQLTSPPSAAPSYLEGDTLALSATATSTVPGPITYRWRIARERVDRPGTFVERYVDGQSIDHTFAAGGSHVIEVVATDAAGATVSAQVTTSVTAVPGAVSFEQRQAPTATEPFPPVGPWLEGPSGGFLVLDDTKDGASFFQVDWDRNGTWDASASGGPVWIDRPAAILLEGQHAVDVRVSADDGSVATETILLDAVNQPPDGAQVEVLIDGAWTPLPISADPPVFEEGSTVTIRFRLSDPGPWDRLDALVHWGDGTTERAAGLIQDTWYQRSHTYADVGLYSQGPIIVDAEDESDARISPTGARGVADLRLYEVLPVVHGISVGVDGDGVAELRASYHDVPLDAERFVVDWGDGTTPEEVALPMVLPAGDPALEGSETFVQTDLDDLWATHTYGAPGSYTVTLTVYDDVPAGTTVTTTATVTNRNPSIDALTRFDVVGFTAQLDVAASDPDAFDPTSSLQVSVGWGDGTSASYAHDPDRGFAVSHTYWSPGTYPVAISVFDSRGASSDVMHGTVVVHEPSVVSGRVTRSDGTAVEGAMVLAYAPDDGLVASAGAATGLDGRYAIAGLPQGDYAVVVVAPPSSGLQTTWLGGDDRATATVLTTVPWLPASGADVVLSPSATIAGTVVGPGGEPVSDVRVRAWEPDQFWVPSGDATTAADGRYTLHGLAPGSYHVSFTPLEGSSLRREWHIDAPSRASSTLAVAPAGSTTIDAQLAWVSVITGTVTASGAPVAGATVAAFAPGHYVPSRVATTAADGTYSLIDLSPGTYRLRFSWPGQAQAWSGPWAVGEGTTTTDVDMSFDP